MVSRRDVALTAAAAGASAVAFRLGTGLHPVWWLTWLAPLPVLLAAPRIPARAAGCAAFVAWLAGETGVWGYYTGRDALSQPVPLVASFFVATAALFAAVVVGAGALMRSGRLLCAACLVPAGWAVAEFAVSGLTPNGLFWSLAYTQVDVLPVVQTAAVTGACGITFLVLGAPAALAALLAPAATGAVRVRLGAGAVAVLAAALGYGAVRLAAPAPRQEPGLPVAVLAAAGPPDPVPVATPQGRAVLDGYLAQLGPLIDAGARVVVLPEKTFVADDGTLPVLAGPLADLAASRHADIVVGLVLTRDGVTSNAALDFRADGGAPVEFDKHHLIPVLKDGFRPGRSITVVSGPQVTWGITICKDLDFPGLMRQYRQRGARLMLAPALDFDTDAWLHSREAVLRGVEDGMPVVRSARLGAVTVSDGYGRVLAEGGSGGPYSHAATVLTTGATRTPYTALGDWFPWACLVLLAGIAAGTVRARLRRVPSPRPGRQDHTPGTGVPDAPGPAERFTGSHVSERRI